MPSVNATERAMPTVDISEFIPLVAIAIEMDCTITIGPDLQKLGSKLQPLRVSATDKSPSVCSCSAIRLD